MTKLPAKQPFDKDEIARRTAELAGYEPSLLRRVASKRGIVVMEDSTDQALVDAIIAIEYEAE